MGGTFLPLEFEPLSWRNTKGSRSSLDKFCYVVKNVFILILKQLFLDRSSIDIYMGVFLGEMCSDRCKNHDWGRGCREKISEGTSSATFDVRTITMKSDPRLNWSFDSSIRYSGLSRHLLSSSRRLSRSYRRELLLFVSSPSSSSRQLPRSTRREFLLLDSSIPSSSRRLLRPPHYASLHLRLVKCRVRPVDP